MNLEKICPECKINFKVSSNCFMRLRKFCSKPCAARNLIKNLPREKQPHWKGGKSKTKAGYFLIRKVKGSMKNKYILEHRLVMEKKLNRPLHSWEHIHHINRIKTDNRPENLLLVTNSEHRSIFHGQNPRPCVHCRIKIIKPKKKQKFCTKRCFNSYWVLKIRPRIKRRKLQDASCKNCKIVFRPRSSIHKYCSRVCYSRFWVSNILPDIWLKRRLGLPKIGPRNNKD